ncbi:hypothetical protein G5V57_06750 [Nordella sp. HKS 07]|uniref:heparin lyase I family protein n=1 Tax=Nordella sp. HKS 07 TaxID=2712222 RepID=UPI0013E1A453|nr:heparin lyase I family protein [Nordella sp. HKS 07]QIG47455.1 hypothetical protein G5V57_06750 [Nordella sp. HKS 07]
MRFSSKIFQCIAVALVFFVVDASAAQKKFKVTGFDKPFLVSNRNQPGGFTMDRDPVDAINKKKVYRFEIVPRKCVSDDCEQQSARASVQQVPEGTLQPKEAWYGWDMYLPTEFPFSTAQTRGHEIFTEFKDQHQCQLVALITNPNRNDDFLSWSMEKPTGQKMTQFGGDCEVVFERPVIRIREVLGGWHRYELFARWSKKNDGKFQLYLDGTEVVNYNGITCWSCDKMNYFLFGNYLCCTPNTQKIARSTVFYRFVSRARTRDGLVWE